MRYAIRHPGRRGVILPVALLIIGLLAVLAAQVVFRSTVDLAALQASEASLKARMAAEAGLQKVIAVLQASPDAADVQQQDLPRGRIDMDAWYDMADHYEARIVQGALSGGSSGVEGQVPGKPSAANPPTWRFSVVACEPGEPGSESTVRFGVTDESSKLNLNVASREQLLRLIQEVVDDPEVVPEDLVKAIDYWRSDVPEGQEDQSEDAWYQTLDSPYVPKHAPFDSVEELLLVRGMNGRILYGEDWNRNGLLDPSEDDGDASFPPDNGDGQLDRGLYPFLTVWSSEPNTSNTNRPRVFLNAGNADTMKLYASLPPYYTVDHKRAIGIAKREPGGLKTPLDVILKGSVSGNGFTMEDLPMILDDLTCVRAQTRAGLVNVNTAPAEVLVAIGFTAEEARRIVTTRSQLTGADKTTLAWLIQQGVVDMERLNDPALFQSLTTRSFQFHVESVGFADHVGTFCRLEAIITMQGRMCQVAYWRDLSGLGLGWPVHGQEESTFGSNLDG